MTARTLNKRDAGIENKM